MRMKVLLIIFASLVWNHTAFAQLSEREAQEPAPQAPSAARKLTPQQEAELHESQRLSLEVIKLYNRQKYDEALPLAIKAVEITERLLGAEDEHVGVALRNLAEVYVAKRQYEKAEPLFLRAISIDDKSLDRTAGTATSTIDRYICLLYETRAIDKAAKAERAFYEKRVPPPAPQSIADLRGEPLTGGVLNGRAIKLDQPEYPAEAKRMGAIGIVRVQVLIDETGKVIEAKVLCGHPIFARAALESAYKSRFTPTKLSGMAVKVNGLIIYNFR